MGALAVDQKVTKLIALTASDRMEEARTAAYLACKAIREKGLIVVAELPRDVPPPPPAPPPWQARKPDYYTSDAPAAKVIRAKFDSACKDCRSEIFAGETCVWIKGQGVWHMECRP